MWDRRVAQMNIYKADVQYVHLIYVIIMELGQFLYTLISKTNRQICGRHGDAC